MDRLYGLARREDVLRKVDGLIGAAAEEIFSWPVLSRKEKGKRFLKKYILFGQVPPRDPWSWPNALLAEGLSEASGRMGSGPAQRALERYLDGWMGAGLPMYYLDDAANGMPLLDLYERTGEQRYLDAAGRIASYLKEHPRDEGGSLPYRIKDEGHIYADAAGMICPFLCRYGKLRAEAETAQLGAAQLIRFLEKGMDGESGLPYHGFHGRSGVKHGCIGWGRAVGWLLMGLSESLEYLPESMAAASDLRSAFRSLAGTAVRYQREDGSFAWLLPAKEGPADSSATAMIACSLLQGMERGDLGEELADNVLRAGLFLLECTKDGKVGQCSGECEGFAQYPQRYGSYPWSVGPTLELLCRMGKGRV